MSSASNLGYSNINPYSSSPYVNGTSSNYSGNFSSNEIPGCPGLAGAKSNVDAAAGHVPSMKGGSHRIKRKIKNITKYYKKMKGGSRRIRSMKKRLRSRYSSVSRQLAGRRRKTHRRRHRQRGGYSQYMNNMPQSATYQVAGVNLPASQLALANPPPFTKIGGDNVDNYNRYTNQGFPSKGH